jgi:hypothetical protein
MDPAKQHKNQPFRRQFVGRIWGEKINAQRGYDGSAERRH